MSDRHLYSGIIVLFVTMILLTSGCIFNQPPSQEAADAANSTAETMFQSFNTGNYDKFSENLSAPVKKNLNESSFFATQGQIQSKYGNYTSKSAPQGSVIQGYNNFVYDCSFEKGTLKIRLVMNATNRSIVEGLWYPNGI